MALNRAQRVAFQSVLVLVIGTIPCAAQSATPPFEAAAVVADDQARFATTLDYDDDGYLDALSVWFPTGQSITIRGYRNDGAGHLVLDWGTTFSGIVSQSANVSVAAAGDFNADGRDDFVLTLNDYIGYWMSNGAGLMPTITWLFQTAGVVNQVVAADFDGDGRTDVATRANADLRVWITQASLPPLLQSVTTIGSQGTHQIFAADANADGHPDVGALSSGGALGTFAHVQLFPAATAGSLMSTITMFVGGVANPMPVCGDVDGDGDADLVAFSMPAAALAYYHVCRRTGPTSMLVEIAATGGPATHLVDIDLDGDLDGACCSGGGSVLANIGASKYELCFNNGTGQFTTSFEIAGLGSVRLAGTGDLDHDGDVDLVAGRCVYYGNGPGGLPPFPSVQGVESQRDLFDVDDDGDVDFRATVATAQRNNADGTFVAAAFGAPAPPPGRTWASNGFPGDFDQDGDVDWLLDAFAGGITSPDETHLLRNVGCGAFVDAGIVSPPGISMSGLPSSFSPQLFVGKPGASVVADLDSDGDLDIVVSDPGAGLSVATVTGLARVWWNQGGTAFTPGQDLSGIVVVAAEDLDGDGILDLVAHQHVISSYTNLVIVRGLGQSFVIPGPPGSLPIIDNDTHFSNRPAVADFDGDGDLDVFSFGNSVGRRFLNNGNGTFQTPIAFTGVVAIQQPVFPPPIAHLAFAADVDGDTLLDVVAAPVRDNPQGMAILLNAALLGTNGATAPIKQVLRPFALADIDGDGDGDAVGATLAARNNRFAGAASGHSRQYGAGIPGAGGIVPIVGEVGPFRVGMGAEVRLRGGVGGAAGYLVIGLAEANVPMLGGTLLASPEVVIPIQLGGAAGVAGVGSFTLPYTIPPDLAFATFYKQVGLVDAVAAFGISASNGMWVDIRP